MTTPKDFCDKASRNYDKTEERFEFIHQRSRECTKGHLTSSDIVLDYGCGTGTASLEMAVALKEIHAIDISANMVALAKEKLAASSIENVSFHQTGIFDPQFKKETFDRVLAFNVLHTVPNPEKALDRIHELLKPTGKLICVTPCLRGKMSFAVSIQIKLVRLLCKIGIIPVPIRRLKSTDLDELLSQADFHVTDSEEIFKGATSYFAVAEKK